MPPADPVRVAHFSLEIFLETDIPTYAGGLGILIGDLLRSSADLEYSSVAVSLAYNGRQFDQSVKSDGTQVFSRPNWQKSDQIIRLPNKVQIYIQETPIWVSCWRYDFVSLNGFTIPIFLLDTDLPENPNWAKNIVEGLYTDQPEMRLSQEILLGIGGVKMLRELGYNEVNNYHLHEGHAAFVPLALMYEGLSQDQVRQICSFTTHTPVAEGQEKFDYDLVNKFANHYLPQNIRSLATENLFSMTHLCLNTSKSSFAVSKRHQEVSSHLYPDHRIRHVTNGIHHRNWISPSFQDLYSNHLPTWMNHPSVFTNAVQKIPDGAIWAAHVESKTRLLEYLHRQLPDSGFDLETLTIVIARRPVTYKRPLLLYHNLHRLIQIGEGKIQIIQCGKSHPADEFGQELVKNLVFTAQRLKGTLRIAYLENYSPKIARLVVSGGDVWLNTPRRPFEASGTSGMKAATNGLLNFSILDGWWIEGFSSDPLSGFTIGPLDENVDSRNDDDSDSEDLYNKLEKDIIPMYYNRRSEWISRMKHAVTLGAVFNTHRCIEEYIQKTWGN